MDLSSIQIPDGPSFTSQPQSVQRSFSYDEQPQFLLLLCPHKHPVSSICRNQKCLRTNLYLSCTEQCPDNHFNHPQDVIPYKIFQTQLQSLKKSYIKNQQLLTTKIRQIMNQFLHIKLAICKYIDTQIQIIKKLLNQNYNLPDLKDCIYLIKQYHQIQENIIFDSTQSEKQINYYLSRSIHRLNRTINQLLKNGMNISQCQNLSNNHTKNYQYKIQGNIMKILKLLETAPQHVSQIKIYLNQEQHVLNQDILDLGNNISQYSEYILYYSHLACTIFYINRRIYKQTYQKLLKSLYQLTWITQIHLVIWDNFIDRQGKLDMIKSLRNQMENVTHFLLQDKLKNYVYQL